MYRIRFHGRGGQGMKMASRILGTAFFLNDFEVQDAPRYGAERRGAPIFAFVRADHQVINERGIIHQPDLVIVADESLITIPPAGILAGANQKTVMFMNSSESSSLWKKRLNYPGTLLALDVMDQQHKGLLSQKFIGTACAGAAAALPGVISRDSLIEAIQTELNYLGKVQVKDNLDRTLAAFDRMAEHSGLVCESGDEPLGGFTPPDWIELPFEDARISAPTIHAAATSEIMKTGQWRVVRPVIDTKRCTGCWWVCSTFCPDSAIIVNDGSPEINYDFCKGCMICMTQCPSHAISAENEQNSDTVPEPGGKKK